MRLLVARRNDKNSGRLLSVANISCIRVYHIHLVQMRPAFQGGLRKIGEARRS